MNEEATTHDEDAPSKPHKITIGWLTPVLVCGLVIFIILIAWLEENVRGHNAWRRTRDALEARHENLEWTHYLPEPPPPERNMLMAPGMEAFIKGKSSGKPYLKKYAASASTNLLLGEIEFIPEGAAAPAGARIFDLSRLRTSPFARDSLLTAFRGMAVIAPDGSVIITQKKLGATADRVFVRERAKPAAAELKELLNEAYLPAGASLQVAETKTNFFALAVSSSGWVAASDYAAWAETQTNVVAELDAAFKRPECWLPGDYSIPFLAPTVNFVQVRTVAQALGARAQAFVLANRPDDAYRELERIRQLRRILATEPMTLVCAMINVAVVGLEAKAIEDGFSTGVWQDKHLRGFVQNYSKTKLLPQILASLRSGERAGVIQMIERLTGPDYAKALALPKDDSIRTLIIHLRSMPSGWKDQNLAVYASLMQENIDLVNIRNSVDPVRMQAAGEELAARLERRSPMRLLTAMAIPNTIKAAQTCIKNQTKLNQVVIASALELYRARHGEYPQSLDALAPEFLENVPTDIILGKPLRYQKRQNGQYALYSPGWDGNDDSGKAFADANADVREVFASKAAENDWVWLGVPQRSGPAAQMEARK